MRTKVSVKIGRLKLANPVMVASGTFGYGREFADFMDLRRLGALVTKTITLNPRRGNFPPRTAETPSGMINSIGLENPGLEVFIADKLPDLARIGVPLIISIASEGDPEEFISLVRRLDGIKAVAAIELNISCPNIHGRREDSFRQRESGRAGLMNKYALISQDAKATYDLVKAVRKFTRKTLITKLSPNVTDIVEIAQAAESAGSDAVSLINTITGMTIDVCKRRPKIASIIGGVSGPAIRPVAVRMVWEVFRKIKLPIIGMGGIIDTSSALEFILAGSTAVSVGTANFINPRASIEVIEGIKRYLISNKIENIGTLVGNVKL